MNTLYLPPTPRPIRSALLSAFQALGSPVSLSRLARYVNLDTRTAIAELDLMECEGIVKCGSDGWTHAQP